MDRERLTRLLEEPGRVAREDLGDLKALAERYPWFSGAQLLRVAGEQAAGDVLFDETLQSATAHLPSRAVLFDLVEKKGLQIPAPPRPEPRILRLPVQERPAVVVRIETPVPPPSNVEPILGNEIPADNDALQPEPAPLAKDTIEDPLERQILEAALASAYDLTWKEETTRPEHRKPQEAERNEGVTAPAAALVIATEALPEDGIPEPRPQKPTIGPSSRHRFTAWLESAEGDLESPIPASPATPPHAKDRTLGTTGVPATDANEPQPSAIDTHDLIDRFIQQQTPEPVRKNEFFTPQQAAKRSLDDTAGLVTETLARVYEKQGNLPKAIEAYGKLALKYPHKSDYFAALQKSLEEQLNK